jgi:hypothetical protein
MKISAIAAVVAFALFATVAAGARSGSGLRGKVLIEPGFPVCRVGEPCSRPAADTLLYFSTRGRLVRRTRTKDDGTYRIKLAPGRYKVAAPGLGLSRNLDPVQVVVPRARFRRVDFTLDIGIQ